MKIKTGLPYNNQDLGFIQQNSAFVDMSSINFPNIKKEKQIETALIYLRNTNFNVQYDFSKCSFQQKKNFLIQYFTNNYILNIPQLNNTWMYILLYVNGYKNEYNYECILNKEQLNSFLQIYQQLIITIIQVIISLPVFLTLNITEVKINNNINQNNQFFINNNIINLFEYQDFILLYENAMSLESLNFTKIFKRQNNQLFNAINNKLPFGYIIYGLLNQPLQNYKKAFNIQE